MMSFFLYQQYQEPASLNPPLSEGFTNLIILRCSDRSPEWFHLKQ